MKSVPVILASAMLGGLLAFTGCMSLEARGRKPRRNHNAKEFYAHRPSHQGVSVYFYAQDGQEPPHIHIIKSGCDCKLWLDPVRLAVNHGFRPHQLREAIRLTEEHEDFILSRWNEFFSRQN